VTKAVLFDLGFTLVSYEDTPFDWQVMYRDGLAKVLQAIGTEVNPNTIQNGEKVLLKYNTRVNSREYEVDSDTIFSDLFSGLGITDFGKIGAAKEVLYSFFQRNSSIYDDAVKVLSALRSRGCKTGVLTDVAYGMDTQHAIRDIAEIIGYFDVVLTSRDVGFRKPNTRGYLQLAEKLDAVPNKCIFVGDEDKDIFGANKAGMMSVLIDRKGHNADYGQKFTVSSLVDILPLI
jgi:putative hydrolase of the HAD superfamily